MDDERDDASTQSENPDATGKEDEVGVAPSGLLAGGLTAANMGSGTIGMLGGGALGGLAAAEAVGEGADGDPAQHDQLNLDALAQYVASCSDANAVPDRRCRLELALAARAKPRHDTLKALGRADP